MRLQKRVSLPWQAKQNMEKMATSRSPLLRGKSRVVTANANKARSRKDGGFLSPSSSPGELIDHLTKAMHAARQSIKLTPRYSMKGATTFSTGPQQLRTPPDARSLPRLRRPRLPVLLGKGAQRPHRRHLPARPTLQDSNIA